MGCQWAHFCRITTTPSQVQRAREWATTLALERERGQALAESVDARADDVWVEARAKVERQRPARKSI
jgi:hypothetical protein